MGKGLIDKVLDLIFDEAWVGKRGETLTERELKLVQLFGRKGKVLRNVYLPKTNGETSELDLVFITQKGIFIFESKNYSGWIFGNDQNKNWTAVLPNKQKYRFYNPVMQNRSHMKWMEKVVGSDIPLFSIIVFSERCELKEISLSSFAYVIKRERTYATVREIWNSNPDMVSDDRIDEIYEKLQMYTNADQAVKAAHIEAIQKNYLGRATCSTYLDEQAGPAEVGAESVPICPRCGSKLVLRVAKKGPNAGNSFWGCSAFPKCRYTQNVE